MILKMSNHKSRINKIMHYANDKAILNDTYNMECLYSDNTNDKIREMEDMQQAYLQDYDSRKYYHLILSPKANENENNPETLRQMARELLDKHFNNCQATISIHNDKENGNKLDCHIILNASQINGYKIDMNIKQYDTMKEYAQVELAKQYNYEPTLTKNERTNQTKKMIDYAFEKQGKKTNRQIIQDTFDSVIMKTNSFEELQKELKKHNIEIGTYKTKDNETKYTYKLNGSSGISEDKLGANFSRQMINNFYEMKKEKQQEQPILSQPKVQDTTQQQNDIFNQLLRDADKREDKKKNEKLEKDIYKLYSDTWDKVEDSKLSPTKKDNCYKELNKIFKDKEKPRIEIFNLLQDLSKAIISLIENQIKQNTNQRGYSL